jgi:hypothetical protein
VGSNNKSVAGKTIRLKFKKKSFIPFAYYEKIKIRNIDFFHFIYSQKQHVSKGKFDTSPAMKLHIYIYYQAPYFVFACGWINEALMNKGDEPISKAEEIIKTMVGSIHLK